MNWKATKLYSIFKVKCPRCHEGDMFAPNTLYSFSKFARMYNKCQCCGQTFEPEPGYYFGAMFVSYGITAAIFLMTWLGLTLLLEEVTFLIFISAILIIIIGGLPIIFRLSRSMWINIFIGYEGPCSELKKK